MAREGDHNKARVARIGAKKALLGAKRVLQRAREPPIKATMALMGPRPGPGWPWPRLGDGLQQGHCSLGEGRGSPVKAMVDLSPALLELFGAILVLTKAKPQRRPGWPE